MKFEIRKFSKRFPPVECAIFVIHEPVPTTRHIVVGIPPFEKEAPDPYAHRGTAAALILPDGRFWIGVCLCAPQDQFIKSVGRQKAIGRAFVALRKGAIVDGRYTLSHGNVTIVEAINGIPLKEPRIGDAGYLKFELQSAINEAKKRQQIVVTA